MNNVLISVTFILDIVFFLIGFNLAIPKAKMTTDLVTMIAIVGNKLIGAVYIIGALIVFALLIL